MNGGLKGYPRRPYKEYLVASVIPASAVLLTLPHGLGKIPSDVHMILENIVAQVGWVPGDRLTWKGPVQGHSSANACMSFGADRNNVFLSFSPGTVSMNGRTAGTAAGATATSWKIILRVYS